MVAHASALEEHSSLATRVEEVLAPHGLVDAYRFVVRDNPSNALPYHNLHHTDGLVLQCAEGAAAMGLPSGSYRALLLAALFHDFGHSGGRESDHRNIEVAVGALDDFCDRDRSFEDCRAEAGRIIVTTEFPPVCDATTLSEKIIRDADRMQITLPGWRTQIFDGLRAEIGIAMGRQLSLAEMVALQLKFMEGVAWQTSWATERASREWGALIGEVRRLVPNPRTGSSVPRER